jgi:hypothetical protein
MWFQSDEGLHADKDQPRMVSRLRATLGIERCFDA